MSELRFILGDWFGRVLSVCPGTVKSFDSYEEARQNLRYGGSDAKFIGLCAVDENERLISKKILWEDGMKNLFLGESLNERKNL